VTDIIDLQIFARVARTSNMSAAGRDMGLSPAAISKHIGQLEERLGARLFQRSTRHLTLTETGAGYFKRVVDILSLCEEAEDFVNRRNGVPQGQLRVTLPAAFGSRQLAPVIDVFLARYPGITLDVSLNDSYVDIIRDGFDLAIRVGKLGDSSLVARRLGPDRQVICAAPAYIAKHGAPQSPADLKNHNCLLAAAQDVWQLEGPQGAATARVRGSVRADSGEFLREALRAGLGLALRSVWEIVAELKSGELQIVLPQHRGAPGSAIYALYPSRGFMPAKVKVLVDYLAELFGSAPPWERDAQLQRLLQGLPKKAGRGSAKRAKPVSGPR
jgi:DNA-binding transcriptional LysR family regulator